jgi:Glycosyl transferase family 2/N-terminal domain of galactosyltransferase
MVPFRADTIQRAKTWEWCRQYWGVQLPAAQLIVQGDEHIPFSKTTAVNRAFRQAKGDVVVILDADCYIPGKVIVDCARRIRRGKRLRRKVWFVPYRHFYRLTEEASRRILASDPAHPLVPSSPPADDDTEIATGESVGHWFGALIQIMHRDAFIAAGGMDERFSGWGGEDVSFMKAVDTLYAKHLATRNQVLHLWHPANRTGGPRRASNSWAGQRHDNFYLASRYTGANGRSGRMYNLTREEGAGIL